MGLITATEIKQREAEWFRKWQEAEEKLLQPIVDRVFEILKDKGFVMTITEALAEIKTITKRIQSKREFIETYQLRVDSLKDPLDKDGGSAKAVSEAAQSISDLEDRAVALRSAIAAANTSNTIALEGLEKPIADWLIWRREIAPGQERFLIGLASKLNSARNSVAGQKVRWGNETQQDDKLVDIVVNIDEVKLNADREQLKNILGQLDGQLSLKNATIMLTI